MSKLPHHALRSVGGALVVFAGLGFWHNGSSLFASFPSDPSTPYFSHAFYTMSAVCLACYLVLLVIGIQFIRLNSSLLRLFIGVMVFEVVYFFSVAFLWLAPGIGTSVCAATGVANGGQMFQFVTLFPLWGSLLARWAKNGIEASQSGSEVPFFASEQVSRPSDWAWAAVNFVVMLAVTSVLVRWAWRQLIGIPSPPALVGSGVPVLLSVANALVSVKGRRRRRREQIEKKHASRLEAGLCPRCEYNLKGLTVPRCPECGVGVPASMLDDLRPSKQTTLSEDCRQS
ncbi:MAG: hypothetical protein GY842_07395 [bacterium]|nr:hypothetical protein [bacterium]